MCCGFGRGLAEGQRVPYMESIVIYISTDKFHAWNTLTYREALTKPTTHEHITSAKGLKHLLMQAVLALCHCVCGAPPRHHLSTTSAPPRHHLGTTSPPRHHLGTTLAPPRHHLGTTSAPPQHHLSTISAPPHHLGTTSAPPQHHLSTSAPPRHHLNTISALSQHHLSTGFINNALSPSVVASVALVQARRGAGSQLVCPPTLGRDTDIYGVRKELAGDDHVEPYPKSVAAILPFATRRALFGGSDGSPRALFLIGRLSPRASFRPPPARRPRPRC
eukprot:913416-Prorocentrum_minimum.AAC.1